MSPKKSNRKTKGSSKAKETPKVRKLTANASKAKSSSITLAKRKQIAKKVATKLRPTNTSLILESMKRRMAQRKETQMPKRELKFEKPSVDEEESEAKRILKRIMEERESEEEKKETPSIEKDEEEPEDQDEIPIIIPEIEMKQPEEKVDEEEKIEAEKEEKEVDSAKEKEQEEKEGAVVEQKNKEGKAPEVEEEEKEMKRFFEPVAQDERSKPMPIIPETQTEPVVEKAEEKFNWTRFFIALVSAVVLCAAAGYGFMSLGYSNMFVFGGSLLVLVASTAYFYIVLRSM